MTSVSNMQDFFNVLSLYEIPVLNDKGDERELTLIIDDILMLFHLAEDQDDIVILHEAIKWFLENGGEFNEDQDTAYKFILFDKKLAPSATIQLTDEESQALDDEIDDIIERLKVEPHDAGGEES